MVSTISRFPLHNGVLAKFPRHTSSFCFLAIRDAAQTTSDDYGGVISIFRTTTKLLLGKEAFKATVLSPINI